MKPIAVIDTECYRDYWLVMFRDVATGETWGMDIYPGHPLCGTLPTGYTYVSFNGLHYDWPVLSLALGGLDNGVLKQANDDIIVNGLRPWDIRDKYGGLDISYLDHIDIMPVAPGLVGLKAYGGRLHSQRLQDLPIDPAASISPEQRLILQTYCANDLQTTQDLYEKLTPALALRVEMSAEYGIDLRSRSDAQIAEAVIRSEIERRTGNRVYRPNPLPTGHTFQYAPPSFLRFQTPGMQQVSTLVSSTPLVIDDKGYVIRPDIMNPLQIRIGGLEYAMQIGGLHSTEKSVSHKGMLTDRDVTSYYPAIILNQQLYPQHLGTIFLEVYREIVERRLAAKAAGNKAAADSLKIVINGSFGKFGNKYSILYSPHLLLQVTITGQLAILMLIEALTLAGVEVISGNTDGIVFKAATIADDIIRQWESVTGFATEETQYSALYSKDVNNYIAIKAEGGIKAKGLYGSAGLQKNPTNRICVEAVLEFLQYGAPLAETILGCRDVRKFLTVRKAAGGAEYGGQYLGKVVRWYYAVGETRCISTVGKGDTVARSEGARPLMDLPQELPADMDYNWYITEAQSILKEIGIK